MTFQNNRYTGKSKILRISSLFIVIALIAILLMAETIAEEFKYYKDISLTLRLSVSGAILLLYAIVTYVRFQKKYCFIYFTDEDKKHLVFRYYHIKIIGKKFTTYKIPIPNFYKYEIQDVNKKKQLFLFQRVEGNKVAKYPPISLTALTKDELITLTNALQTYTKN